MALSDTFIESAFAPETDDVWLILLTFSHPELSTDIRVVNNDENITSNGEEFLACPFELSLPSDQEDAPPTARLRVDNVDRRLTEHLREVSSAISIKMEIVLASDPDTVEQTFSGFSLTRVRVDSTSVTGTVALDDIRQESFPARSFNPGYFPALF